LSAATIRVRRPSGRLDTFDAVDVRFEGALVRARGHWRGSTRGREYSWPASAIAEIRWRRGSA